MSNLLSELPLPARQLVLAEAAKDGVLVVASALVIALIIRFSFFLLTTKNRELMQREARWQHLMDNLSAVVWFASHDGREMLYVNAATEPIYGRPAQDFFTNPRLWIEVVHPEDRARVERHAADIREFGATSSCDYRIRHSDGDWRWVRCRASALYEEAPDSDSLLMVIGGVVEDITEMTLSIQALAKSEQQYSSIVATAMDAIITVDAAQSIVVFNQAAGAIFRVDPEQVLGQRLERFIPMRARERHGQYVDSFARTGSTNRRMGAMHVLAGLRADGEEFPIEAAISRFGEGGEALMTVVLRDVTETRRAAAALEAQRVAEAASLAKTEFLSRMSHELRTPLNAVLGFAQLLQASGEPLSERQCAQIEHIRMAGWHLLALINDVLDVSRIEAGALQIQAGDVDAYASVDEAMALSRSLAERHGVRLVGPTARADCSIRVDATRWRQVLLNLLSNATKYNRPGGLIEVTLASDGERLQVCVADTGLGMSADQLARLYEPFNRLGRQHGGIEGTGIGLTLTRELLLMMDGRIEVQSTPGEGTRVTVSVPRGGKLSAAPAAALPLASADCVTPPRGTVLYIEDNPVNTLIVEQLLARWPKVMLVQAEDGATGVALADQLRPDLVLLDMHLPDMNGLDVLERLRARSIAVPVVALSASAMSDEVSAAKTAGAIDYWTKPLDFEMFAQRITHLLGARSAVQCEGLPAPR